MGYLVEERRSQGPASVIHTEITTIILDIGIRTSALTRYNVEDNSGGSSTPAPPAVRARTARPNKPNNHDSQYDSTNTKTSMSKH